MFNIQTLKRLIGVLALAGMSLLGPGSSAFAHSELVSTSPEANSAVQASQETITLTFGEPPLVDGAAIVVMNQAGDILDSPAPELTGSTLSIPWPTDLTPGVVSITWRATAADGHVQSGEFTFNYTAAAESGVAPSATALPTYAASATPEPMVSAFDMPLTTEIESEEPEDSGSSNIALLVAIAALAGLVAAGLYMRRSK